MTHPDSARNATCVVLATPATMANATLPAIAPRRGAALGVDPLPLFVVFGTVLGLIAPVLCGRAARR